jgi:DNA ligase-associated metallophosphoesterase
MILTKKIAGQTLSFHPSGAAFWEDRNWLLIADVHLGKVSHFRKAGLAVPYNAIQQNFLQLASVVDYSKPLAVIFLGDLFHSESNNEWLLFENWVRECEAPILLVAGNHDIISPARYVSLGIQVFSEIVVENLKLTHHPAETSDLVNICGHIHPAVRLYGEGRQWLTLSCFFHRPRQLILPAFGHFTGSYIMQPQPGDCVYAIAENSVLTVCES